MSKHVLISGGTGLVGKHLTQLLIKKGYKVAILTRSNTNQANTICFKWDIATNYIDKEAIRWADYIIHLAGENIASKRWTNKRKQQIINSRVKSTELLYKTVKEQKTNIKAFISASATGYYGAITSAHIYTEKDNAATDFLGKTCKLWENEVVKFESIGVRTVCLRTGVVLTANGGALQKMVTPIKYSFGATLGKGNQYMPWIAINDLCNIYALAIENKNMHGAYNAVTESYVTNKEFTQTIAQVLRKKIWLPNVPTFILRIAFGEMADIILKGSRIKPQRLIDLNYKFKYTSLNEALKKLLLL